MLGISSSMTADAALADIPAAAIVIVKRYLITFFMVFIPFYR